MAPENPTYVLRAGPAGKQVEEKEVERLNAGHTAITRMTRCLIPPQLGIDLKKPLKVADVATGTGAWLVALHSHLPAGSVFDGYDISDAQFPAKSSLPEAVNLTFPHDMRKPFSKDLRETYDIVHVRLVMYALKKDEWAPAVQNLTTLLKPGGWIIWEDTSYTEWLAIPASAAHCRFLQLDMASAVEVGRDLTYSRHLLSHFNAAGLINSSQELFSSWDMPELEEMVTTLMIRLHELSLKGVVAKGGVEGLRTPDDAAAIIDDIKKDQQAGMNIGFAIRRICGMKSSPA